MNKKGFTLIEILTVIGILGLMGVMITISLTSTLKNTTDKKCTDFISEVEEAACSYASLTKVDADGNKLYDENDNRILNCDRKDGSCTYTLKKLYDEGMIETEVNPCNSEAVYMNTTGTVTVSWNASGEKICKYNGN